MKVKQGIGEPTAPRSILRKIGDTISTLLTGIILLVVLYVGFMFMVDKASCVKVEGTKSTYACIFDFEGFRSTPEEAHGS